MNYRVTALTPLLVGDGRKLAPIDYMVWRDQVNVLDQERIITLLAKGPRLEGYLAQVRRAEKLDFASWGGFAQNFAGRRIPFEHGSLTQHWAQTRAEHLFIPTFCSGASGPYLPASALRGALRTALTASRWTAGTIKDIADRMQERPMRRPGEAAESAALGGGDPMRLFGVADSAPFARSSLRVYLLRIASLSAKGPDKFDLSWKPAPAFAEMAPPGTTFTGRLDENQFLKRPEVSQALRIRGTGIIAEALRAANNHAERLLEQHRNYARMAGLKQVEASLAELEAGLSAARESNSCLINLGWGAGFLSKAAYSNTGDEDYRRILRQLPYYERAIRSGLPFPKTRRVVFLNGQPATLAGWARVEIA